MRTVRSGKTMEAAQPMDTTPAVGGQLVPTPFATGAEAPTPPTGQIQPSSSSMPAAGVQQAPTPLAVGAEAPTPAAAAAAAAAAEMVGVSQVWLQGNRQKPPKPVSSANRLAPAETLEQRWFRLEREAVETSPHLQGGRQVPTQNSAGAAAPTPSSDTTEDEEDLGPPDCIEEMIREYEEGYVDEDWEAWQKEKRDVWRQSLPDAWAQVADGLLEPPYQDYKPLLAVWKHLALHLNVAQLPSATDWTRRPRDHQWEAVEARIWAVRKAIRDGAWGPLQDPHREKEREMHWGKDKHDLLALAEQLLKPGEGPMGFFPDELTVDGFIEAIGEIGREWADRHLHLLNKGWDAGKLTKDQQIKVPLLTREPAVGLEFEWRTRDHVEAIDFNQWIDVILGNMEVRARERDAERDVVFPFPRQYGSGRADTPQVRSPELSRRTDTVQECAVLIGAADRLAAEAALERAQVRDLGARPKEQRQKKQHQHRGEVSKPLPLPLPPLPRPPSAQVAPPAPPVTPAPPPPPAPAAPPDPSAQAQQQRAQPERQQKVADPTPKPLSYAKVAAAAPGPAPQAGRGGSKPQQARSGPGNNTIPGRAPDWEEILREDDEFLQDFFNEYPGHKDPDQRYVIRLTYTGTDPRHMGRQYIERDIVEGAFGFSSLEVWAVITPLGTRDADLVFRTETNYRQFWARYRDMKQQDQTFMSDFHLMPIFRCDVKVLTVFFRSTTIPGEDIGKWLDQHCQVLKPPERQCDAKGYFTGEMKAVIKLQRDLNTGLLKHVPKLFYLGADRGCTRYSGQPMACFQCGGWRHLRRDCKAVMCARCSAPGHRTAECRKASVCNLCNVRGHEYRLCPQAYRNTCDPERYEREREEARRNGEFQEPSEAASGTHTLVEPATEGAAAAAEDWNVYQRRRRGRKPKDPSTAIPRTADGTGMPPTTPSTSQAERPLNAKERRQRDRRLAREAEGNEEVHQLRQKLSELEEVRRKLVELERSRQPEAQGGTEAEEEESEGEDMEVATPSRKRRSEDIASQLSPPERTHKKAAKEGKRTPTPSTPEQHLPEAVPSQQQQHQQEVPQQPSQVPEVPLASAAPAGEKQETDTLVPQRKEVEQDIEPKLFRFKATVPAPESSSDSGYGSDKPRKKTPVERRRPMQQVQEEEEGAESSGDLSAEEEQEEEEDVSSVVGRPPGKTTGMGSLNKFLTRMVTPKGKMPKGSKEHGPKIKLWAKSARKELEERQARDARTVPPEVPGTPGETLESQSPAQQQQQQQQPDT